MKRARLSAFFLGLVCLLFLRADGIQKKKRELPRKKILLSSLKLDHELILSSYDLSSVPGLNVARSLRAKCHKLDAIIAGAKWVREQVMELSHAEGFIVYKRCSYFSHKVRWRKSRKVDEYRSKQRERHSIKHPVPHLPETYIDSNRNNQNPSKTRKQEKCFSHTLA